MPLHFSGQVLGGNVPASSLSEPFPNLVLLFAELENVSRVGAGNSQSSCDVRGRLSVESDCAEGVGNFRTPFRGGGGGGTGACLRAGTNIGFFGVWLGVATDTFRCGIDGGPPSNPGFTVG